MAILKSIGDAAEDLVRIGTFAANEIGSVPQDFEKFRRSAGALMKAWSLSLNAYTFATWFNGEILSVNPNGQLNVVGVGRARDFAATFALNATRRVFWFSCPPGVQATSFNEARLGCSFVEIQIGTGQQIGETPATSAPTATGEAGGFFGGTPSTAGFPSGNAFTDALARAGVTPGVLLLGGVIVAFIFTMKR